MRKNRIMAILATLAMIISVGGCGNSKNGNTEVNSTETIASGQVENTETTESTEFNYEDEHIKAVQSFLEKQKFYGYSGQVSENDKIMITAEEYYDFNTHIVEDKSDYTKYREALLAEGYSDSDIGTSQTIFHSYIDCDNSLYIEFNDTDGWVLNEANQSNVDYETGANYSNAWELWVSTMVSSNLFFKDGSWSEDGNTVSYTENFENNDSKETITMIFEKQGDSSLKPVDFTSAVTTTTTSEGYDVDDDGNISSETSTKTTAVKNKTYMVYDYENHDLKIPSYTVVEDKNAVDTNLPSVESTENEDAN